MEDNKKSFGVEYNILGVDYDTNKDTVLVLLSTYNRIEPIIDSIESIVNQDYNNVLLHIIDDNSTEDVISMITEYINQTQTPNVILSKKTINSGPYINFNHILKYHENDEFGYWVLQGSDDVSDKKRISTLVNFLEDNPDFKYCRSKYTREDEQTTPKYGDSMVMCRKEVISSIGYYDNNRFGGDSDYYNRLVLKYGKSIDVPETLYYANAGDNRLTKIHGNIDRKQYVDTITKEYKKTLYRSFVNVNRKSVVCGVATIYDRKESLKKTIESIIDQVDKLVVYQNGYYEVFDFLRNPKIVIKTSLITGIDMGDAGKFYTLNEYHDCYYFSIDDDLIYPKTYVQDMVNKCREYDNKKVITHHGRSFSKFPIESYYRSASERYACLHEVRRDVKVQFGGTGVMCFHTSILKLPFEYFKNPNMADIWVGKYCMENNIEILCLKHNVGYIKYIPQKSTIYDTENKNDKIQTDVVNNITTIKVEEEKPLTIYDTVKIEPISTKDLNQKQINYDKINSIFSTTPKIVNIQPQQLQNHKIKLNSQTIHNIQRPKKRR
jgi:hypothetical protein